MKPGIALFGMSSEEIKPILLLSSALGFISPPSVTSSLNEMFLIIDQQLIVFTSDYDVSCYPGFRANYYRLLTGIASDTNAAAQEITNALLNAYTNRDVI